MKCTITVTLPSLFLELLLFVHGTYICIACLGYNMKQMVATLIRYIFMT